MFYYVSNKKDTKKRETDTPPSVWKVSSFSFSTISGNERLFHSITDINYSYDKDNKNLIHELSINDCQPYNFYKVEQEEIYELYENTIKNVKIQLREYIDYFILIYLCDTIDDFNQLKIL